ncbi:MAG: T9SS type A sorting domain-containing protein [Bacteroidota bacterium]
MKNNKLILLLLIFCYQYIQAQEASKNIRMVADNPYALEVKAIYPHHQFEAQAGIKEIENYIYDLGLIDSTCELRILSQQENRYSKHYLFKQYINGVEVYASALKINMTNENQIYSIYYSLVKPNNSIIPTSVISYPLSNKNNTYIPVYISVDHSLQAALVHQQKDPIHFTYKEELLKANEVLFSEDLNSYFAGDTSINGLTYNPDPITPAYHEYGSIYTDRYDSNSIYFDAIRQYVSVRGTDSLGAFYLKSPFCAIVEIEPPVKYPVSSLNNDFFFNRYEDGFEDFNAYYHINHFHDYINDSLGFSLVNYPIECDVHALNGADNSLFTYSTTPPSLHFGEGGVDDAEDADVVIHEYCHAISHDAAPFSNSGNQRNSLDEGFCDYLACSYSNSINAFHSNWVFNWDGHNEFWDGRMVDNTNIFPRDISTNIYKNGGIWSSALWEIESKIGRDIANKLAIQTMYDNVSNMTLDQAAQNYLVADTILYGGIHYCKIVHSFIERGLISPDAGASCDFSAIPVMPSTGLSIINSEGFALGNSSLYLISREDRNMQIDLYSATGQLLLSKNTDTGSIEIPSSTCSSGMYIIQAYVNNQIQSIKLIKY